jgi:transcriptional regulator with XRE-family HTH domain
MKLNQTEVQKRTGINNKTLSRYENDGTEPDSESLRKLSELYGVSADWLIGNKKESVFTLPESEIEHIIKETENKYNVNLRDDPMVLASMRSLIQSLAQAKKGQSGNQ